MSGLKITLPPALVESIRRYNETTYANSEIGRMAALNAVSAIGEQVATIVKGMRVHYECFRMEGTAPCACLDGCGACDSCGQWLGEDEGDKGLGVEES